MDIATKVRNYVDSCKEREPIFVRNIKVDDYRKNARNIAFHRLEKENVIKKYTKGVYYKPKITKFGELGIDIQQLILKQYIKEDKQVNGYLTGPILWNTWNITTQVPNKTWVATNLINRTTEKEHLKVKLIKPKTVINNDNYQLLQLLDIIEQIYQIQDINWDNYIQVLNNKIEKLSIEELKYIINLTKYYNKFVNNFIGALIESKFKNTNKYDQLYYQLLPLRIKANTGRRYKLVCKVKIKYTDEWGFY